ncbi:MAG: hypothetical protein HRT71_00050 [Flavobacteriales bacterium]|nr:hypothetical protein [Flavobacteriales bacterium]
MTKRISVSSLTILLLSTLSCSLFAQTTDHDHAQHTHGNEIAHNHQHPTTPETKNTDQAKLVTGQGDFVFSWDKELTAALPKEAIEFEPDMHGGFNEDPETGIVYTGIPGYGLCTISPDLTEWKLLGKDERLKDNIHGITFFIHKKVKYLAVAQEHKRVLVLTLDGKIVSEIVKPTGDEFKFEAANAYYLTEKSNFGVTDVAYLDGTIYVAHGYSKGDFILTIKEKGGTWSWGSLAWGGKGHEPGQFHTAHGVYAHEDHILVSNRAAGELVKFTKKGEFVESFEDIPVGSLVCNVSYKEEHYFLNALKAIGKQKSAPIYVHDGKMLKSTIIAGDLGIPVLTNIHQAWPHIVTAEDGTKQLYLLVHGWNIGKFAVLKME